MARGSASRLTPDCYEQRSFAQSTRDDYANSAYFPPTDPTYSKVNELLPDRTFHQ